MLLYLKKQYQHEIFGKNFAIKHLFGAVVFGVVGGNGSGETHVSQQLNDLLSLVHQHTFR